MLKGYVGSYSNGGDGIYTFRLDETNGTLSDVKLFSPIKNSTYIIAGHKEFIYATYGAGDGHGVAVCSRDGRVLDLLAYDVGTPCHIADDAYGEFIYTANYSAGTVAKVRFSDGRLSLVKKILIKDAAGCHQITVLDDKLILPALLMDKVFIIDKDLNILNEIELPEGSGPRHGVVSKDGEIFYLVTELSNELFSYRIEGNSLTEIGRVSLLPPDLKRCEGSAAIRMSVDGKTLMVSTRFANIITMLNIEDGLPSPTQFYKLPGDHPRDILNVCDDRYLLVANRYTDQLICLSIENGRIVKQCSEVNTPQGVSIYMDEV